MWKIIIVYTKQIYQALGKKRPHVISRIGSILDRREDFLSDMFGVKVPKHPKFPHRGESMSQKTQLTEHEKHNLNALKLFLERSSDLKVLESGKVIDALPPEDVRAILDFYDRALKDPQLGTLALTNYLLRLL